MGFFTNLYTEIVNKAAKFSASVLISSNIERNGQILVSAHKFYFALSGKFAPIGDMWKNQDNLNFIRGLPVIDGDGYRLNVGIVICNHHGQVFWAKRYGQHSWQFPQGGIDEGETPEQAMFRELYEEVGLTQKDVKILATSRHWLKYKLPKRLVRWDSQPVCIGQKQKWFLLRLEASESKINMQRGKTPEFDGWRWVSYWYPVRQVVSFKRDVYRRAMKEFASIAMPFKELKAPAPRHKRKFRRG